MPSSKVCALPLSLRLKLVLPYSPFHLTDLEARGSNSYTQVQVINLDVKDNHEDATLGAFLILELCNMVRKISLSKILWAHP